MPRSELDRIDTKVLDVYYKPMKLTENGDIVPDSSQGSEANI